MQFWKQTGAASVMLARAAEWNPSIFREEGSLTTMDMANRYVSLAIECDQPFVLAKYCLQQLLGGEQAETGALGGAFLASATLEDICSAFGRREDFQRRQAQLSTMTANSPSTRPSIASIEDEPSAKKMRLSDSGFPGLDADEYDSDVLVMHCPFVRGHYGNGQDIPKVCRLFLAVEF